MKYGDLINENCHNRNKYGMIKFFLNIKKW